MSDHVFFAKGRNRGNERKVFLQTATLLVGKAPTKQKRIKMKIRMPLPGKVVGTPDWVTAAYTFVAQNHDTVCPAVEFKGYDITFSDENLFNDKPLAANKCQMKSFVIAESGESENPDVDMTFLVYAPFSSALWKFCGQMGGEDFWAKFEQGEPDPDEDDDDDSGDLELEAPGETEPEEAEESDEEGEEGAPE